MQRPSRETWRAAARQVVAYAGCALVAAVVASPLVAERAIERVSFSDTLGTFPVEVRLCHTGKSALDTGIFGRAYWAQTGVLGFGACARTNGPPEAGGTLASYVDPRFIRTNVELIDDPKRVVTAYSAEFVRQLRAEVISGELLAGLAGGAVLFAVVPRRRLGTAPRGRQVAVVVGLVVVATFATTGVAVSLFRDWPGAQRVTDDYPLSLDSRLSFESAQTHELAEQVAPFITTNRTRIDRVGARFEARVQTTFAASLATVATGLAPRDGERIVLAEADPQGSFVGTAARTSLYDDLLAALPDGAVALRTISGDITSNGTVAEARFVDAEAAVAPGIPVVAVAGDHDSEATWRQLADAGVGDPDFSTVTAGGIDVAGANDREHKALFGVLVTNDEGISETELGRRVREAVGEPTTGVRVLLHQATAAAGYLGVGAIDDVRDLPRSLTSPVEDGVPDLPPGTLSYGHWHELAGPFVLWNTDGDQVTWTVVDQLGTSGGVENAPTFNRFSTPTSAPLKPLTVRLQYVDTTSGLQTGYATLRCTTEGDCSMSTRTDVGLPGGQPG